MAKTLYDPEVEKRGELTTGALIRSKPIMLKLNRYDVSIIKKRKGLRETG